AAAFFELEPRLLLLFLLPPLPLRLVLPPLLEALFAPPLFVRPSLLRCLLTVAAAMRLAVFAERPFFLALDLMCSYCRSSLLLHDSGIVTSCRPRGLARSPDSGKRSRSGQQAMRQSLLAERRGAPATGSPSAAGASPYSTPRAPARRTNECVAAAKLRRAGRGGRVRDRGGPRGWRRFRPGAPSPRPRGAPPAAGRVRAAAPGPAC